MNTILSIVSAMVLQGLVTLIVMYARRSAKTAEKAAALAERSCELRSTSFYLISMHESVQWQKVYHATSRCIRFSINWLPRCYESTQLKNLQNLFENQKVLMLLLQLIEAAERGIHLPTRFPITTAPFTLSVVGTAAACRLDAFAQHLDPSFLSAIYPSSIDSSASATASGGLNKQGTVH